MNGFTSKTLLTFALVLVAGAASAQDTMKKDMSKDGMMKKGEMTMQQCKDHMAMTNKGGAAKDDMTTKKDAMCAEMAKKDGSMKMDGMKKDGTTTSDPMKK